VAVELVEQVALLVLVVLAA
jgi:hypothetical protein